MRHREPGSFKWTPFGSEYICAPLYLFIFTNFISFIVIIKKRLNRVISWKRMLHTCFYNKRKTNQREEKKKLRIEIVFAVHVVPVGGRRGEGR